MNLLIAKAPICTVADSNASASQNVVSNFCVGLYHVTGQTSSIMTSAVAFQLRAPPKVSARAPAHRSYHFRGVKLKSCIKKIHHNLYISKQANVRIKHADTEGLSHKKSAPMPEFSRTFMQTLRNESNDTEKHEKFIKTQYHLNSLEQIFLFANAVMTLS